MISSESRACKLAFIGAHGVGKTTLAYGLAARLKARDVALEVVVEVARRCPLPINEQTTIAAQSWILHTQIADELVAAERYPVVICDRSVLDNYVYLLLAHGREPALEAMVDGWMPGYDLLLHVPPVDDGELLMDGTRSTNRGFRDAVEERLLAEIDRHGVTPIRLDPSHRAGWLDAAEKAALEIVGSSQMLL